MVVVSEMKSYIIKKIVLLVYHMKKTTLLKSWNICFSFFKKPHLSYILFQNVSDLNVSKKIVFHQNYIYLINSNLFINYNLLFILNSEIFCVKNRFCNISKTWNSFSKKKMIYMMWWRYEIHFNIWNHFVLMFMCLLLCDNVK
jgi:hypothetical protein